MFDLANLKDDADLVKDTDTLGGGTQLLESGVYTGLIKEAYLIESQGGAMGLVIHAEAFDVKDNAKRGEITETIYFTNRKKETFYVDQKTGKKHALPGYRLFCDLAYHIANCKPNGLSTEELMVSTWDFDAKKKVPKKQQVITDFSDQEVYLGILQVVTNKNRQTDSGEYVPTAEKRTYNTISKVFNRATGCTVNESLEGLEEGRFIKSWNEKYEGQVQNRFKDVADSAPVLPGAPAMKSSAAKTPLFADPSF